MTRQLSDFERQLLQIMWEMSGPRRTGEPHGAERKKLVRFIRRLRTRGAAPIKPENAPGSGDEVGRRFMEVLERVGSLRVVFRGPWPGGGAPGPRKPPDLRHLEKVPEERRYAHLPKPWKGRAGRAATQLVDTMTKRKLTRQQQAVRLHAKDPSLTHAAIADLLRPPLKKGHWRDRTVRRYLNGR